MYCGKTLENQSTADFENNTFRFQLGKWCNNISQMNDDLQVAVMTIYKFTSQTPWVVPSRILYHLKHFDRIALKTGLIPWVKSLTCLFIFCMLNFTLLLFNGPLIQK